MLDQLTQKAHDLFVGLDELSYEEKTYCPEICHRLEVLSWEMLRLRNELTYIQENR